MQYRLSVFNGQILHVPSYDLKFLFHLLLNGILLSFELIAVRAGRVGFQHNRISRSRPCLCRALLVYSEQEGL